MKKLILGIALVILVAACSSPSNQKFVVILQAGTESHEGMARALHAILYAQELHEKGYEVALIFDGAGTEWAKALQDPEHKLHGAYKKLDEAGITQIICDFCATAFKVRKELKEGKVPLVSEYKGHPSFAKWIQKGYIPIIL